MTSARGTGSQPLSPGVVYAIFALSGAAALVYEILWARWLALVLGSTTASVSVVLACFMFGLALGSWGASRALHRVRHPLLVYAWLETGIGVFALAFPLLTGAAETAYTAWVGVETAAPTGLLVRSLVAFALLAVPTALMGATLPILADSLQRSGRVTSGWKAGLLYAANTLGAATGVLAASFVLIELLGTRGATLTAAGLNLGIALLAFLACESSPMRAPAEARVPTPPIVRAGRLALVVLALAGANAMASEVLWTRFLETLVGNSSYAFALILVVYLVGIGLGSAAFSFVADRLSSLPLWLAGTQLAMGACTAAALSLCDALGTTMASGRDVAISAILGDYLKASLALLPLAICSGAVFPLATRVLARRRRDADGGLVGRAYAWNTLGAVAGALVGGFVVAPRFDFFEALYLLAAVCCGTGLFVAAAAREIGAPRLGALGVAAAGAVLLLWTTPRAGGGSEFARRLDALDSDWQLVYHEPGLQGVTSAMVERDGDRPMLLVNASGMTVKARVTKMMAHLPLLVHPRPERTLVICFGMGTTYRSATRYGGDVTVVELVDEVYDAFSFFHRDAEQVRDYPRGRMVTSDGRHYLELTRERYDVITVDPPPPIDAAGVNHLYARDFLELARDRLAPGGIVAHWIPFPGTLSGVGDQETFKMLLKTFSSVFPHTYLVRSDPRVGVHVLGSREPIAVSQAAVQARLAVPSVRSDLFEWGAVELDRYLALERFERTDFDASLPLVTDDRPHLEFHLLRRWRDGAAKAHRASFPRNVVRVSLETP